jgi:putative pyruvate formate lyase activating enzyme
MSLPSYTHLSENDWQSRIDQADALARSCRLCPRNCGVDRFKGEAGFCRAPGELFISSIFPHHGEEPPLSGSGGSGTVFFSHCTLKCVFCQNWQISWEGEGESYTTSRLAQRLVWLQGQGCHNINLVTATHFLPWVLRALCEAASQGLSIPIVYNCGGYETVETICILESVVDIWLPDMKYGDNGPAQTYSTAGDYVEVNREAIRAMFRQAGPLKVDRGGMAYRGLIIRHLVLPDGMSGSESIARYLSQTYDPADIAISLMAQYRPLHRAAEYPDIAHPLDPLEYERAKTLFIDLGFEGFYQETDRLDSSFCIDFTKRKNERLTGNE